MTTATRTKGEQTATLEEAARLVQIEECAEKYSLAVLRELPKFQQAAMLARGIQELRKLLLPMMPTFMPLMNCKLGFKTDRPNDKNPHPYSVEVVADCLIEATLRGLRPIGNEWNIISGGCYTTKEGYTHLLSEYPGLTDLKINPSVPVAKGGGAVVHVSASWKLDGVPDKLERDIPIRTNAGSGVDQILGKANRKARAAIYEQITGSPQSGVEGEVGDPPDALPAASRSDGVLARLEAKKNGERKGITAEQEKRVRELIEKLGLEEDGCLAICESLGVPVVGQTAEQAGKLIARLEMDLEPAQA